MILNGRKGSFPQEQLSPCIMVSRCSIYVNPSLLVAGYVNIERGKKKGRMCDTGFISLIGKINLIVFLFTCRK